MSQTSIDRLRDYLAQLPPQSQALLMREYERAIERNEDVNVANFVLELLRTVVRGSVDAVRPRVEDPARLVFRSLEPFLVEGVGAVRPGQIRRASLLSVWQWLEREGAVEAVKDFEDAVAGKPDVAAAEVERAVRKFQQIAAEAILKVAAPGPGGDRSRGLARVGAPHAVEDLPAIGAALKAREALDSLATKIPGHLTTRANRETHVRITHEIP